MSCIALESGSLVLGVAVLGVKREGPFRSTPTGSIGELGSIRGTPEKPPDSLG